MLLVVDLVFRRRRVVEFDTDLYWDENKVNRGKKRLELIFLMRENRKIM
jgi:hypothetical protein